MKIYFTQTVKKLTFIFIIALLSACKPNHTSNDFGNFIYNSLKKDDSILDLRSYKNSNWNKLYILEPYVHKTQFDATLQKYEQEIVQTGIAGLDDRFVLLLFNQEQLVDVSIIKKSIDFSKMLKYDHAKIGFSDRNNCIFRCNKLDEGWFKILKAD